MTPSDLKKLHAEHDAIRELLAKLPSGCGRVSMTSKVSIWDLARIADKYREYIERERSRPDPLGEALNSGDGSYRP